MTTLLTSRSPVPHWMQRSRSQARTPRAPWAHGRWDSSLAHVSPHQSLLRVNMDGVMSDWSAAADLHHNCFPRPVNQFCLRATLVTAGGKEVNLVKITATTYKSSRLQPHVPALQLGTAQFYKTSYFSFGIKVLYTNKHFKLECGPMPSMTAALPNIGGALYESLLMPFLVPRHKAWLTPAAGVPCSNASNMQERKTWT